MTHKTKYFDETPAIDTKGWKIDFTQLHTAESGLAQHYSYRDKLYESPDERYACLFYQVLEYRMGSEIALIALFENKQEPQLLANPQDQWFDFQDSTAAVFSANYLLVRKGAKHEDDTLSGFPFIALDLSRKRFAFVDFDATSCYYSPVHISGTLFRFHLDAPREIKHISGPNRHEETFDLSPLKFYDLDLLPNVRDLYIEEKKNMR